MEHRHKADNKVIEKSFRFNSIGQMLSFALSILSLGAVCLCVVLSQPGASIAQMAEAFEYTEKNNATVRKVAISFE